MNGQPLTPDDPKLTAYALGELAGDERAAVEAAVREHPALRAVVEEIRATSQQLESALGVEPIVGEIEVVSMPAGRTSRMGGHASPPTREPPRRGAAIYRRPTRRGKLIRFPQSYFLIGTLAAACVAVLVLLNRDRFEEKQRARIAEAAARQIRTRVIEVPLSRAGEAAESSETAVALAPSVPVAPRANEVELPARPNLLSPRLTLLDQNRPVASGTTELTLSASPTPSLAPVDAGARVASADPEPAAVVITPALSRAGSAVAVTKQGAAGTPGATAPARAGAPGKFTTPPDDEIVVLDKFVVRADNLFGFNTLSSISRAESATRGLSERKDLPPAPAAAQFARNTEAYSASPDNNFVRVRQESSSTFSADVDTASYANVRRIIEQGMAPPRDAVRIEEMLNYFPYRSPPPVAVRGETQPFAASLEVAEAPWAPTHRLVRIGLKSREVTTAERPAANLVFLIDVSASMSDANKLPLVKESMRLLIERLRPDDRVAIVVYAGASGLALPSTPVAKRRPILDALNALEAGGSTNGAMGIHLAYDVAKANFAPEGINRVILCTDGDFNVGTTNDAELSELIQDKAASGVLLTVLGFGMGNYKDATLEKLAHMGNGNYGYIDTRREAEKLLVEQVNGTLVTIAKDVKVQVDFNPAKVSSYRLIGYENRQLRKEDFNNDKVDAGEIGAGHMVTALYEVVPVGVDDRITESPGMEDVKYQALGAASSRLEMPIFTPPPSKDLLTVQVRYKKPDAILGISSSMKFALADAGTKFANASADFRFAAAVAQFGMILRDSPHRGASTLSDVVAWAANAATGPANDPGGYRGEFIDLVRKAQRVLR